MKSDTWYWNIQAMFCNLVHLNDIRDLYLACLSQLDCSMKEKIPRLAEANSGIRSNLLHCVASSSRHSMALYELVKQANS